MRHGHYQLTDFSKDNYRLYVEKPDPNFSPERNYAVIKGVITDYEQMRYTINPIVVKSAGDRADILASFAKYKLDIGGGKQIEEWLGKERMAEIYGEKLMSKIRIMETVKRLNRAKGNTKFESFYLPER